MDLGPGGRGYLLTGASRGPGLAAALVDDGVGVLVGSRSADGVPAALSPAESYLTGTMVPVDGGLPRSS